MNTDMVFPVTLIDDFIKYCQNTTDDQWCMEVVRTKDQKANCLFGHLFEFAGDDKTGSFYWDMFEEVYATTYMVYQVNDGKDPDYPQSTPKARCVQYLKDLKSGKAKTTYQIMDEELESWKKNQQQNA